MNTTEFVRSLPYFSQLGPEEIKQVRALLASREFARGDVIMLEGEPCRGLYMVRSGRIRVYKTSPDGREQVLRVVEAGGTFNEVPNFDGGPNPASASAVEPSTVYLLRREHLLEIARRYPAIALALLGLFAGRLRHLTGLVEDLSFKHVTSRLAKILLEYASEPDETDGDTPPRRRLTQQEMASMIGTAREMVGRSLKTLEAQGALTLDRHRIVIKDRAILERLA